MTREQHEFKPENVTENEIYKFITAQWQHQNQMSWSRLYFVLALEIATLSGAFSIKGWIGVGLIVMGTLVGIILYRLMRRDWHVRDQHLEILDKVHMPLKIRMVPPAETIWSNGQFLLKTLFTLLLITNLTAIVILFYWYCSSLK